MLHDIEQVGKQQPTSTPLPDPTGKFKIPRYKQPYIHIPNIGAAPNTSMQGATSPTATPAQQSSTGSKIGGTLGSLAGTAIGGPIGGAIGGVGGSLFGGLFGKDGGSVPRLEAGGGFDEGDRGDTLDAGDTAVATRVPVTGNPEDEAAHRARMGLPPSRGDTLGLDKLPTRPSIPSPDPLAPFLGTEGPRSLTGPPRGSPAGGLPVQAREAPNLMLTRERVQRELTDNPRPGAHVRCQHHGGGGHWS